MGVFEQHPAFERELLRSIEMRRVIEHRTEAVAERASEIAADDPRTVADDLHRMIEAEVEIDAHGAHGRVVSKNFKGHWYEFGASGVPARPYLRPALESEVGPIEKGRGDDA